MQFSGRRRKVISNSQTELYAHALQFYGQPPLENISLSEFEMFAVERLKLLKTVENAGVSHVKQSEQYTKKLESEFKALNFPYRPEADDRKPQSGPNEYEKRRKDHISHYILRLAYCQTEDLRRWFIQQEVDLFRFRFNDLSSKQKLEFLHRNNLQYEAISLDEKKSLQDKLVNSSYAVSGITVEDQDFYKVPFQDALDLVRSRKVYLKAGYVYIPHQDIVTIVLNDFRTRLSKALALTARSLPAVHSDERLQPLLNHLSHAYVGQDYSIQKNVGKISLEQIDSLSGKSFPLCMRQLHQNLRETHHLRHGGRMQYGLFLKGIGLSLEQALQFWRSEFVRGKVDADKFDKAYAYGIRHMFGKEGKRADYTPYSCMKVILSNPPSQGDHHGCPFRHSDPELLKQKLQFYKVSPSGISQILELVKGMHYQLACQKYFELTHNIEDASFSLNHPNQYFIESQRVLGGGKDIKREADTPQRSQETAGSRGSSSAREAAANASQGLAEMTEELDSFFQDA
ncbi:DNA primase large subunit [Chelmon rostratus]|uniref:DNA primase large subunit n=1 Tax=Chelmon rostratus TaxID=109905 RepID=UPI001BED2227|nr:DNA primase large subunit [Chelmon rostratus]XP_041803559.1 DNA primase large subunit [Chelmon rostratus]XP_041803560.1 DNA primase large subunit [Chelmon rostratus]XP_041803561.1 DNA primase large subunit [Chelmon rostratus]